MMARHEGKMKIVTRKETAARRHSRWRSCLLRRRAGCERGWKLYHGIGRQHGDVSLSYATGLGRKFGGLWIARVNKRPLVTIASRSRSRSGLEFDILVGGYRKGGSTRVGGMAFGKGVRPIHGSQGFSLHWRGCWRWRWGGK
jgi:hypothetical protein